MQYVWCSPCKLNIRPSQAISTFWPEIKASFFRESHRRTHMNPTVYISIHHRPKGPTTVSVASCAAQQFPSSHQQRRNIRRILRSQTALWQFSNTHYSALRVNLFLRPTPRLPHGVMTEETSVICLLETQLMRKNDWLVPSQFTHEKWARAELVCTGVDWSLQGELHESFWLYGFWKLVMKFGSFGMTEWDFLTNIYF